MLILTIDSGQGPVDYTSYVVADTLKIEDSINIPTLLDFSLVNNDNSFVPPIQGAYVTLYSTKFNRNVITGFVTNVPQASFLGSSQKASKTGFQHLQYDVQVTSDEWLLNVKAVAFIPAFISQTQGQILAALADILAPGFFDTSAMQGGPIVPFFKYDPTMKWADLAKKFGDAARYRYKVVGRAIAYAPFGDAPLGVSYDERKPQRTFDPTSLATSVLTVPPVNEAIVIGDVEPQQMHDDYFVGDGFTANFNLRHKVFNGATETLLQDDWTEAAFSNQWSVFDPGANFLLQQGGAAVGALNVVTSPALSGQQLGQSYILAQNGLELGGHLVLQHGDFTFVDVCVGLVGAVFSGQQLTLPNCIAGFRTFAASGDLVVPSPSGAQNVSIQPILNGVPFGSIVKTQRNHQYVLSTMISARLYTRFTQPYSSLAGTVFGGTNLPALADITFIVQDIDTGNPFNNPLITQSRQSGVPIPAFGTYAIVDNQALNLNVNFTLLNRPPQGSLTVVGLTGASGSQLPLFPPGSTLPDPVAQPLGFGMQLQTATITSNQGDADQLSFYAGQILQTYVPSIGGIATTVLASTIPAPGARIRLTSWQSGRALADVQDADLVANAAVVDGDDGRRMAVFTDLNPLPRTSDECEQAALAQIADRSNPQYHGSYTVKDYFWDGFGSDYPCTGRYLPVNSQARNILNQNFFVNQVRTTIVEMHDEILEFDISFGQDLFVEKLIARFIPNPSNILEPADAANPPTLQFISEVGSTFLPNLVDAQITKIGAGQVTIDLGVAPVTGCEVRRADYGWGTAGQNLIGVFTSQVFTLPRTQYEQVYYMRQVLGTTTSRFTRTMRVVYPLVPLPPALAGVGQSNPAAPVVQLAFTGDIRNIRGVEIRDFDNQTVLKRSTVLSPADLNFTYNNQYGLTTIVLYAYFWNLLWEYSAPLVIIFNIGNPLTGIEQAGSNLIGNPSFEAESFVYATGLALGATQVLADGWIAASGSQQFKLEVETNGTPRTGQRDGHIQLQQNVVVSVSGSASGAIITPSINGAKCFPVRGGDYYYFGGYARWDGTALPGGVTGQVLFKLLFFDSTGAFVSSVNSSSLTSPGGGYTLLDVSTNVPINAAFMMFQCFASVTASGSPFNTGAVNYMDALFDDCFVFKAIRSSHASYRPLSNPLTAHDAGASATVNIASFTMRAGNTDVIVDSGAITGLAYSTLYYIYYDDAAFAGGVVTYNATTIKETTLLGESRYFVGSVTTPPQGMPDTTGNSDGGSGVQNGMVSVLTGTTATADFGPLGNALASNIANMVDGNLSTFATFSASGNSGSNVVQVGLKGFPSFTRRYKSLIAKCIAAATTMTLATSGSQFFFSVTAATYIGSGGFSAAIGGFNPSFHPSVPTLLSLDLALQGPPFSQAFANPGNIVLEVLLNVGTDFTSGAAVIQVSEAWLEIVE